MKIVHCLNQYMPIAVGGTEVYVHTLAFFQKKSGHDVAVITPHIEYYRPGQIRNHYRYEDIDVYQFLENGNPKDRKIHYGTKRPSGLENFMALIRKIGPDIIHFHELNRSVGLTVEHIKFARQSGAKVFLTMHTSGYTCNTNTLIYKNLPADGVIREIRCASCTYTTFHEVSSIWASIMAVLGYASWKTKITALLPAGKIKTMLLVPSAILRIKKDLREISTNVIRIITLNEWYKDILVKNGVLSNKITVAPSALVATVGERGVLMLHKGAELPIRLVFIGRIFRIKGVHLIIEALRSFNFNQVRIDIFGKTEETDYYKECVNKSIDNPSIAWKGEIESKEVIDRLAHYDVLCLPSTSSEMSPLVIREAFAAGIPVLASDVKGNMDQVKHMHNGLVFEFNSPKSLVKQIQLLIDEPGLIEKLKKNIVAPSKFEIINEAYLGIYETV